MDDQISRSKFLKTLTSASLGMGLIESSLSKNLAGYMNEHDNDFKVRGFHLDMRVEVMTIKALKNLAQDLASMGINALILEYTASYPYQNHATLSGRNSYSRDEIKELVDYGNGLGIQLIPLLENLGHVQYILRHQRYADLRIEHSILSQVDPLNKDAIPLFRELIEDLISLHPSKYIHLGGDETRHLHNKKFSDYIKKHGVSKLYTQYMKQICQIAIDEGKTPLLWADMILKHPQAIDDLPIDKIIFINWIYNGADANKFGNVRTLQKKGCTFWGAPALRSGPDNYFLTQWKYHFNNIKKFIPYSRQAGYSGMIMTSWSTSGKYDYQWQGTSGTLLEMFPQRSVYPLAGFHILIAAYGQALKMREPIDPRRFVINYGQQRFGLSKANAKLLWDYLSHRQEQVKGGKAFEKENIEEIMKNFCKVSDPILQINPTHNQQEFEQFKLMADIRFFYLSVRNVEAIVEAEGFDRSQIPQLRNKLEPLLKTSQKLDHRFIALNNQFLYDLELQRLNRLRNSRLDRLWDIYGT